MALTHKKRRFADALMSGASNADAARDAGYSEKTAKQMGYKLSRDPDVIAYMERKGHFAAQKEAAAAAGRQVNPGAIAKTYDDPAAFLLDVINDQVEDMKLRVDAAKAMMPYKHAKIGEQGKKEQKADKAKAAAKGKFSASAPPKLVVNNK